jgi:hypothetical protein
MDIEIDIQKALTAYGSVKAWSDRLKVPYTTVIGWKDSKTGVPMWRRKDVAAVAVEDGKDIFAAAPRKRRA